MAQPQTGFSEDGTDGRSTRTSTSRRTCRWFAAVGEKSFLGLLEWVVAEPTLAQLQTVEERMISQQGGGTTSWREEEAHTLPTHLITNENDAWVVIYKCPASQQQQPINLCEMMRTMAKPLADERRTLAHTVATQVRSLHVHFNILHPALRTESFVFMTPTLPHGGSASPDTTNPYILDWGSYAATTSSASPPTLTVDSMFEHPMYSALPASERAAAPPWFNQAWAMLMILSEIADWRPMLQRVRLVTNASWKNGTTSAIMCFGFQTLGKPPKELQGASHWEIKHFYDHICDMLAPVAT